MNTELKTVIWKIANAAIEMRKDNQSGLEFEQFVLNELMQIKNLIPNPAQRNVAVICLNPSDFINWKMENKQHYDDIISNENMNTTKRFSIGETTYFRINKVIDLCSLNIDEIIETKQAKNNIEYNEIIFNSRYSIRTQNKF